MSSKVLSAEKMQTLQKLITKALTGSIFNLKIEISETDGNIRVLLRGRTASSYWKQNAQTVAFDLAHSSIVGSDEKIELDNQIEVVCEESF